MVETDNMILFWGGDDFLSNFYLASIETEGLFFPTSEHYYMFLKAMAFNDESSANQILDAKTPLEAKRLGRKVKNFDKPFWDENCFEVMTHVVTKKFCNGNMLQRLLDTKQKRLVEASAFDKLWGIGLSEHDPRALDETKWLGLNLLGNSLEQARFDLSNPKY